MQPNGNFKESRELLAREDQIFGSIGEQFSFLEENDATAPNSMQGEIMMQEVARLAGDSR